MDIDPLYWAVGFCLLVTLAEGASFVRRRSRAKADQDILFRAKREVQEIAQLPLNNPHPLIQVSAEGDILLANPVALQQFPDIKEKGVSHPVLTGFADLGGTDKLITREAVVGRRIYHQTIAPVRVNGQEGYVVYCHDITTRKAYEKELRSSQAAAEAARQEAEDANRARGDFLANMSHELRTPMNGIIGLSDILLETETAPDKFEMVQAVNSSARSLLILLNDLLDFSKIEAGELTIESIGFDPRRVIDQIARLQSPVAARKGLVMRSAIADSVPPAVMGDPSRLQQILNNLVGNALKFTESGSVSLSMDGKDNGQEGYILRIAVTDTGIGIPADKQDRIFAKFQQADSSTARKYGGTGLGLSITRDLAELMGGTISIKSAVGAGTTFTVLLPTRLAQSDCLADVSGREGEKPALALKTDARILVVDDHPINLLYLRRGLAQLGISQPDEANSGKQALEFVDRTAYDLILMDCQMPEMDGFEAARKIRERPGSDSRPTIIAVTADAMQGAKEKCLDAGMNDYISKPVDKEKLRGLLQRYLPHRGAAAPEKIRDRTPVRARSAFAAAEDDQMDLSVFDWDRLREFSDGDKEIECQIIDMFINSLTDDMSALAICVKDGDGTKWPAIVHKLCGAASHVGAKALAKTCDEAQSIDVDAAAARLQSYQMIFGEYEKVFKLLVDRKVA